MASKLQSSVSKTSASGMKCVVVPWRPSERPSSRTGEGGLAGRGVLAPALAAPGCVLAAHGNAAAVVHVAHAAVGQEPQLDPRGVTGHGLVDGVVHDLPDE